MSTNDHQYGYLKNGTEKQKMAYNAIKESKVFEILSDFKPFLAGTIPLDICLENSDLDIICEAKNLKSFEKVVKNNFGQSECFSSYQAKVREKVSFISKFFLNGFEFEIFCQDTPVHEQFAVIHFNIEKRLLSIFGNEAKEKIRKFKEEGLKTEPAFAKFFNIEGDPYIKLANLSKLSDKQLLSILKSF